MENIKYDVRLTYNISIVTNPNHFVEKDKKILEGDYTVYSIIFKRDHPEQTLPTFEEYCVKMFKFYKKIGQNTKFEWKLPSYL